MPCAPLLTRMAFRGNASNPVFLNCAKRSRQVKHSVTLALLIGCLLSGCGGGSGSGQQLQQSSGPATHFSVMAPASVTAGVASGVTVNALDASNNVATSYVGTVHFTTSDAQAVLPADQQLSGGTAVVQVTLFTSGNQTITATDTTTSSITGVSGPINVKVLTATHFALQSPAATTTGTQFNFTVTAQDASNNQVATYSGTVHFTSSDAQALLPGDQSLANGSASLPATLNTAGNQTIAGTDTVTSSITGTSPKINVMGPTHFSVSAPASVTAGSAFGITVTALDAANGVIPAYTGTVRFSSSDSQADLPKTQAMTSGTATFYAALKTADPNTTVTVTDTVTAITGTSGEISVKAAAAANPVPLIQLPLSPGAVSPGGSEFSLTVNGSGFVAGSTVHWNGSSRATTFVSKSTLKATILASDVAAPNTAWVTVVSPSPGGGSSNVVFFEATLPTSAAAFGTSTALSALQGSPNGFAIGDLNGDGILDLVVAYSGGSNISVLLGKGDGTFQTPVNYAAGSQPSVVAVADFNGDGKVDIAVGNIDNSNPSISILLGNGDGTFQPAVNYSVPCCPSSVAVGDFNEDGRLDLVTATDAASVLLGNGDGTFQPVLNYPAGSNTATVAVGDFNGDGHLDLAVANNGGNNVSVLLGNGDGTFQSSLDYPVGNGPFTVVAGDFNGDGILDLAVTNFGDNTVSVLLGNGNGTFQSAVNYPAAGAPWGMTVADFNGDGNLDLAVVIGPTQILFGKGDGTFELAAAFYGGGDVANPDSIVAGDFTEQGRLDLVRTDVGASSAAELVQSMLAPSATSVEFPLQLLQVKSAAKDVMLTNVGTQLINIGGIAFTGTNAAEFSQTDTCGSSLAPETTCSISIGFTPTQVGPRTAALAITNSAAGSPQSIGLNGVGVVPGPNATLSTTSLSISCREECRLPFPQCACVCTSTPPQPISLTDFGDADLNITSITTAPPFSETNTCNSSLTAGNSCTVEVGFSSTSTQRLTGTLDINDNATGSPQVVNLTGTSSCKQP